MSHAIADKREGAKLFLLCLRALQLVGAVNLQLVISSDKIQLSYLSMLQLVYASVRTVMLLDKKVKLYKYSDDSHLSACRATAWMEQLYPEENAQKLALPPGFYFFPGSNATGRKRFIAPEEHIRHLLG